MASAIISSAVAALPQLFVPEHLKCTISTCTSQAVATSNRLLYGVEHVVRLVAQMGEVAGVVALEHVAERVHLVRREHTILAA